MSNDRVKYECPECGGKFRVPSKFASAPRCGQCQKKVDAEGDGDTEEYQPYVPRSRKRKKRKEKESSPDVPENDFSKKWRFIGKLHQSIVSPLQSFIRRSDRAHMVATYILGSYINGAACSVELMSQGVNISTALTEFLLSPIVVLLKFVFFVFAAVVGFFWHIGGILLWPEYYAIILLRAILFVVAFVIADAICGYIAKEN